MVPIANAKCYIYLYKIIIIMEKKKFREAMQFA